MQEIILRICFHQKSNSLNDPNSNVFNFEDIVNNSTHFLIFHLKLHSFYTLNNLHIYVKMCSWNNKVIA